MALEYKEKIDHFKQCPICNENMSFENHGLIVSVSCPRCGKYIITGRAIDCLRYKNLNLGQMANISGWISDNSEYLIKPDDIEGLTNLSTPSLHNKADKLLLFLEKNLNTQDIQLIKITHG
jgi:predicted RNA-binding Zn-ribbon protein involved in translation (DUF1610 family)